MATARTPFNRSETDNTGGLLGASSDFTVPYSGFAGEKAEGSLTDKKDEKGVFGSDGHNSSDEEVGAVRVVKLDVDDTSDINSDREIITDYRQLITQVISPEDDPSLNPWTFRMWFIGLGLSTFGGVLAEIYYFKPQTVAVSTMFLAIISYVIGESMAYFIPRWGYFRYLNPGPFNKKEHAAIVIMACAAANSALGTEVLAVQRLYYDVTPNAGISIFLLFCSQLMGYGMAGLMRSVLLYPTRMLYPTTLPLVSMFETFFGKDRHEVRPKLKLFYIAFFIIFFWELLPEWIFPLLTGLSVFCLANPNSEPFTLIFGGSNGNEGLGLGSICFDWQYISGGVSPLAIPLQAQVSNFVGYILCIVVFCGIWWGNIWEAQNFPFLSQTLFFENGTQYDQLLILNDNFEVDYDKLATIGLPWYASTWVATLLVSNMALAATFTHLLLWNRDDLSSAWSWMTPWGVRDAFLGFNWRFWQENKTQALPANEDDMDPHYKEMLKYRDVPNSWYGICWIVSAVVALIVIYEANSTLPWWGFLIASILAVICILFFGALYAITGLGVGVQSFVQMIGGYLHPGRPMANMYFVLFSYNSVSQGQLLLKDLKIAQYVKLAPRCTFTVQIAGTLLGSVLNWIMMNSIIDNQRPILLSVEGTNIWSGQQPQSYNSQAIAWGGLAAELFSVGGRYQWVTLAFLLGLVAPVPFWVGHKFFPKWRLDYLYTPIVINYIGWLCVGINSSVTSYFVIAFWSQWYLRRRHPEWFRKYNYILAAALDGGTQVMVFILSFAVQGASGQANLIPAWWGANQGGNYDRCLYGI